MDWGVLCWSQLSQHPNLCDDTSNIGRCKEWASAEGNKPHALTMATMPPSPADNSSGHHANGNMVTRTVGSDTYVLSYTVENRLKEVQKNGVVTATFGYDGDGRMVTATVGVTTTYYVGNYFEKVNGIIYYYHGGKRIAMRVGNTLYWLLTDRLGSTTMVVAATSALTGELRYCEASRSNAEGTKCRSRHAAPRGVQPLPSATFHANVKARGCGKE